MEERERDPLERRGGVPVLVTVEGEEVTRARKGLDPQWNHQFLGVYQVSPGVG